jgi:hypothetical protein
MSNDLEGTVPRCVCGKFVRFYSAIKEQGYCSDECYGIKETAVVQRYEGHGDYADAKEDEQ